ncbi:hypothetical protein ACLKA6_014412 [Drosophila palustris]
MRLAIIKMAQYLYSNSYMKQQSQIRGHDARASCGTTAETCVLSFGFGFGLALSATFASMMMQPRCKLKL